MRLALATVAPLLVLGGLELGLRIIGFGYPTRFFLPRNIDQQAFLVPSYQFSFRFFPPALARTPLPLPMAAEKPENTYRVFLFGGSAAYGDPDTSFGVGRYLEVLLEERYPATDFEVVCVAMTAINSHVVLPIARECARQDGDLWVVYMGNNEMVGPFGAGTVFGAKAPSLARVRTLLALKTTRVGQLLDALSGRLSDEASLPAQWGGLGMFSQVRLRPDDPERLRTYENVRGNLDDILSAGLQAGVPIVLSTVASNLKDCSPFASVHAVDLDAKQRAEWDRLYAQGLALETEGAYQGALDEYEKAAVLDAGFAELQFRMGVCHLALAQRTQAMQAFTLARDHDALPVRADTRINHILMETARHHAEKQVVGVDAEEALAAHSPGGVPGRELFYEHVHLTLKGNYLLARTVAEAIPELLPASITAEGNEGWATAETCDRHLAVSQWDRKRLWDTALGRISVPPFTSQSCHSDTTQYCNQRMQEVDARTTPDTPRQDRRLYEDTLALAPEDSLVRWNYAQFLQMMGARSEAIIQGQQICEQLPDATWPHYFVGSEMARARRFKEAAEYFRKALAIRSDFPAARKALEELQRKGKAR